MNGLISKMKSNWQAGITVALVSIPLSVSLALAAGATPQMGIITAVWAGLAAAILGGSSFNIVGPTGALSGILAAYALSHGVETLPLLAILSGVLILIVFVLKLERYIVLIPASVIHGFTLGVALIIGLGQLNSAFGISPKQIHESFIGNLFETFGHIGDFVLASTVFTIAGVVFLHVLSKFLPKFPAAIILTMLGIVLGMLTEKNIFDIDLATIDSKYGEISRSIVNIDLVPPESSLTSALLFAATTIAIVAVLETLISAKVADGMTKTRFRQRKEMLGLGVANVASGALGGIPATAALARTSLNIKSGANSKMSAAISSVTIGVFSVALISYFQYLPLCIVAAILIYVAISMVEAEHFEKLFKHDKKSFFLALLVAFLTVGWEPIGAIGVGTAIALLMFVNQLSTAHGEVNVNDEKNELVSREPISNLRNVGREGTTIVYRFAGELMYINAQAHRYALEQVGEHTKLVVFSLRNLFYIDIDGSETLAEIIDDLHSRNIEVAFAGVSGIVAPILDNAKWFTDLDEQGYVFKTTSDALHELANRK